MLSLSLKFLIKALVSLIISSEERTGLFSLADTFVVDMAAFCLTRVNVGFGILPRFRKLARYVRKETGSWIGVGSRWCNQ